MKKLHQTFNRIMKYFTPNFYFNNATSHSGKITRKTKNFTSSTKIFTPNLIFFNQLRKETFKFLHQIRGILHQTDDTFGLPYLTLFFNSTSVLLNFFMNLEAVAQTCSIRKVFLEISQNSQGNTCARVSFLITLQASGIGVFLFLQNTSGGASLN